MKSWVCCHCSSEFSSEIDSFTTSEGQTCQKCIDDHFGYCEESDEYFPKNQIVTGYKLVNRRRVELQVYQNCEDYILTKNDEFWHQNDTLSAYVESSTRTSIISENDYSQGGFFTCEDCNDIFHEDFYCSVNNGDRAVCQGCYDDSYSYCEECDTSHENDHDHFNESTKLINEYSFKPVPKFRGNQCKLNRFIGFELEIESNENDKNDMAENILENLKDIVYLKSDGSLDDGFEIVSHPMTLEEHKKIDYKKAFDSLIEKGARSHDTSTCGLHFHLDKTCMSDSHKVRFGIFFALQKRKLEVLARRKASSYAKFKGKNIHNKETYAKNSDRYEAVNWLNSQTLEVRIFKGTLRYETFVASMELCQAIYVFSQIKQAFCTLNDNQLWHRFIKFVNKNSLDYPFLIEYLDSKKELLNKAIRADEIEKIEREIDEENDLELSA